MRRWISTREAAMLAVVLFLFVIGSATAGVAQPLDPTSGHQGSVSSLTCNVSPALFHSEPELCQPAVPAAGAQTSAPSGTTPDVESSGMEAAWFAISALPLAAIIGVAVRMRRHRRPVLSH
jgi:hypothetical protein